MRTVRPLPEYLVRRYHGWKATTYQDNAAWFRRLAEGGQHPRAMVIACCDSRVYVTGIFGGDQGEFFIHRNIANLVPPFTDDENHHGTSATIEYAVRTLKVAHIIVLGHSGCGGVQGCYDMSLGQAPDLEQSTSFVGRWMDILTPAYADLPPGDRDTRLRAFEKAAVVASLNNLMTFPFVREAVEGGRMTLHGLWNDIGEGGLEFWDEERRVFLPV
ncbi:MAG: carbonic anhydrase [Rubellimicrobium sp.]|nr:carbonic anhydrase [Rubellimicrobium sp.]